MEGRRYKRVEAKQAAIEEVLRWLEAEEKVYSLVGWPYIRQALNALPSRNSMRVETPIFAALPLPLLPCGKPS